MYDRCFKNPSLVFNFRVSLCGHLYKYVLYRDLVGVSVSMSACGEA